MRSSIDSVYLILRITVLNLPDMISINSPLAKMATLDFSLTTLSAKYPSIDTRIRTMVFLDLFRETSLLMFTPSTMRRSSADVT